MEVTDWPVDLVESGFDQATRFGALPDQCLNARRIMSTGRTMTLTASGVSFTVTTPKS